MREWELENLAVDDIETALEYIGKPARYRNHFLANKPKKQKTHSLYSVPIFLSHEILKNPKPLTESKSCH
jgi:hypothetical protein